MPGHNVVLNAPVPGHCLPFTFNLNSYGLFSLFHPGV